MKKYFIILVSSLVLLSLFGCAKLDISDEYLPIEDDPNQESTKLPNETIAESEDNQPLLSVAVPAVTETSTADDGTIVFQYTYQHMSLVLPDPSVANKIIIDFLNRVDATQESANSAKQLALQSYSGTGNFTPYLYHVTYSPTRIDNQVLSLFGSNVVYSGAFHPDRTCVSASYDLQTGDPLTLAGIMTESATTDAFCSLVLESLSEMGTSYLYENYADTVSTRFSADANTDEDWYFTQTGLCFYFAPYEIAPYSSGVISVEIPFEKLSTLLHKNYLPAEKSSAKGSVSVSLFHDADLAQYTQIAEIIEDKNSPMYLLHTDNDVDDIRIWVSDGASSYTIFAAYHLSSTDAVMIQASNSLLENMELTYKSMNQTISQSLLP